MSILSQHVKPSLSFGQAVSACFSKYATFTGRARRSEYWWFTLLLFVIGLLTNIAYYVVLFQGNGDLSRAQSVSVIGGIIYLVFFLPSIAVLFRRLHDTGHSGWCWLLGIIPLVGAIILLVWCCQDSDPMPNKYGPSPKYED